MSEMTQKEFDDAMAGVPKVSNHPRVIFPYGFKIVDFEGGKVLWPMTPDEYSDRVFAATGNKPSAEELKNPKCVLDFLTCVSQGCTQAGGRCIRAGNPGEDWYCLCDF